MSENKDQSNEEKATTVLKEVHQKVQDNPKTGLPDDGQPTDEELLNSEKAATPM